MCSHGIKSLDHINGLHNALVVWVGVNTMLSYHVDIELVHHSERGLDGIPQRQNEAHGRKRALAAGQTTQVFAVAILCLLAQGLYLRAKSGEIMLRSH